MVNRLQRCGHGRLKTWSQATPNGGARVCRISFGRTGLNADVRVGGSDHPQECGTFRTDAFEPVPGDR